VALPPSTRMGHVVVQVGPLHNGGGSGRPLGKVAALGHGLTLRRHLQQVVEDGLVVDGGGRGVEAGLDLGQGQFGHVGAGMQHRDQVAVLDHPHTLHLFGLRQVRLQERGAVGGRPQDLCMQHAGQLDVAGELGLAGDLLPGVPAGERFADEFELRRFLDDGSGHVPLDPLPLGQRRVGHPALRIGLHEDGAIGRGQPLHRFLELLRGQLQQHPPPFRAGGPQRRSEEPRGHGAERAHVPRAEVGVAHDHVDALQRDVQLVGQFLGQGGDGALAHLDLAGEAGDPAVLADPQEGVEVGGQLRPGGPSGGLLPQEDIVPEGHRHQDPAAGFEEVAPVQRGVQGETLFLEPLAFFIILSIAWVAHVISLRPSRRRLPGWPG
jgi:hypothetical protein